MMPYTMDAAIDAVVGEKPEFFPELTVKRQREQTTANTVSMDIMPFQSQIAQLHTSEQDAFAEGIVLRIVRELTNHQVDAAIPLMDGDQRCLIPLRLMCIKPIRYSRKILVHFFAKYLILLKVYAR